MIPHCSFVSSHLCNPMFSPGTLHIGDEIREINGISVANQTVGQLQKMLVSLLVCLGAYITKCVHMLQCIFTLLC